jgi:hypothetical protein
MGRLTSEQDRYNQTFGAVEEQIECVCGNYFTPEYKGQTGCCGAHEDAVECTNCGSFVQDSIEYHDLRFCGPACISEWWNETVERWGEDR